VARGVPAWRPVAEELGDEVGEADVMDRGDDPFRRLSVLVLRCSAKPAVVQTRVRRMKVVSIAREIHTNAKPRLIFTQHVDVFQGE
jgi:hypothetical protein